MRLVGTQLGVCKRPIGAMRAAAAARESVRTTHFSYVNLHSFLTTFRLAAVASLFAQRGHLPASVASAHRARAP